MINFFLLFSKSWANPFLEQLLHMPLILLFFWFGTLFLISRVVFLVPGKGDWTLEEINFPYAESRMFSVTLRIFIKS